MKPDICMICHKQNNMVYKLRQIENFLISHGITPNSEYRHEFVWGHHDHCQYGIVCNKIQQYNIENDVLATKLEPYIITAARSGDQNIIHGLLSLLQGDYPAVYHLVERLAAQNS